MKNILSVLSAVTLLLFVVPFHSNHLIVEATQPRTLEVEGDNKAEVVKHLGNLPAFFIENQGQTAEEVRYYFKGSDTVYFTDSAVVFQKIESRRDKEPESGTDNTCNDNKNNVGARHAVPLQGATSRKPEAREILRFAQNDNKGNNDTKELGSSPDVTLSVAKGLVVKDQQLSDASKSLGAAGLKPCGTPPGEVASEPLQGVAYRLEFLGANSTMPRARKELGGKVNYFIGNDPSRWHNNIPTYREIVYPGLYGGQKDAGCVSTHREFSHSEQSEESPCENAAFRRGDPAGRPNRAGARPAPTSPSAAQNDIPGGMIDLVYKGVKGGMKYEFIVHPGAAPDVIKMSYTGIDGLSIDESGNLIIHTALGDVNDEKPYCYQDIDGRRVEVAANFKILDSTPVIAGAPKVDALSASDTARPLQTKDKGQPQGVAPTVDMIIPSKPHIRLAGPLTPSAIRSLDAVNKTDPHVGARHAVPPLGMATETLRFAQGDRANNNEVQKQFIYAFEVASYDTNYPLIIDPGLQYSTFLGGGVPAIGAKA